MLFHGGEGDDAAALREMVADVIQPLSGMCWNGTTFNVAEFAAAGSNLFFLDGVWTPITRTSATNPGANDTPSQFVQFGGRSPVDGTRVKLYLFETVEKGNEDMRLLRADSADVDAVLDVLDAFENTISTISGQVPVWYQYANLGQNDYLTHKARR
jgi:hypothetical protein